MQGLGGSGCAEEGLGVWPGVEALAWPRRAVPSHMGHGVTEAFSLQGFSRRGSEHLEETSALLLASPHHLPS